MLSLVANVVADPLPCILSASFAKYREHSTLASYGLILKKGASNKPTSSLRKCAPRVLNFFRDSAYMGHEQKLQCVRYPFWKDPDGRKLQHSS